MQGMHCILFKKKGLALQISLNYFMQYVFHFFSMKLEPPCTVHKTNLINSIKQTN